MRLYLLSSSNVPLCRIQRRRKSPLQITIYRVPNNHAKPKYIIPEPIHNSRVAQTHNPSRLIATAPATIQVPATTVFVAPSNLISPLRNSCANNSTNDAYINKPDDIESKTPVVIKADTEVGEYNLRMDKPMAIPIGVTTAKVRPMR